MTRKTTKSDTKQATEMDATMQEQTTPVIPSTNPRDAYAVLALIGEVVSLFPETPHETSGPNAFNTNLVVVFEDQGNPDLYPLLALIESDPRVLTVEGEEGLVLVSFHSNFRTQDSRDPFGLAEAYAILSEQAGEPTPDAEPEDEPVDTEPEVTE